MSSGQVVLDIVNPDAVLYTVQFSTGQDISTGIPGLRLNCWLPLMSSSPITILQSDLRMFSAIP